MQLRILEVFCNASAVTAQRGNMGLTLLQLAFGVLDSGLLQTLVSTFVERNWQIGSSWMFDASSPTSGRPWGISRRLGETQRGEQRKRDQACSSRVEPNCCILLSPKEADDGLQVSAVSAGESEWEHRPGYKTIGSTNTRRQRATAQLPQARSSLAAVLLVSCVSAVSQSRKSSPPSSE
jgi:hypothetical protein